MEPGASEKQRTDPRHHHRLVTRSAGGRRTRQEEEPAAVGRRIYWRTSRDRLEKERSLISAYYETTIMASSNDSLDSHDDSDDDSEAPILVHVDAKEESALLPPCPVTILSGFLGSGKTTLVKNILRSPDHGKRIAVIENEFGGGNGSGGEEGERQGLQVESIIARDGLTNSSLADLIELPNGCVCCTVKDSLVSTLENLLNKRQDLDYILIECSGMANPGPIAALFWLDDALESRLRLDGIVTLVDARNVARQLAETEEAARQIAYADRILINKTDLIQKKASAGADNGHDLSTGSQVSSHTKELDAVVDEIRSIHPTAPIRATTYAAVSDLDWLLDARCYDSDDRMKEVDELLENETSETTIAAVDDEGVGHSHNHDHQHHNHNPGHDGTGGECAVCSKQRPHRHTKAVATVALVEQGSVNLRKLHAWLADILWPNQDQPDSVLRKLIEMPNEKDEVASAHIHNDETRQQQQIYRMKGILSVRHEPPGFERVGSEQGEWYDDTYIDKETGMDSRRYIVQAVHDLWDIQPEKEKHGEAALADDERAFCKLVVIGRYLDEAGLQCGLQSCMNC